MRKLNVNIIASSSSGNCIVVSDGASSIMLDAGLSYKRIASKVSVTQMDAVLITHEHKDHSHAIPELLKRGANVVMSEGTADAVFEKYNIRYGFYSKAVALRQMETEHWYIRPFDVTHDVKEPLGYLIQSKATGKKALYVVDSSTIDYDFSGVSVFIIEANYDEASLENSSYEDWLKNRVRHSHYSLENLLLFLTSSDLSQAEEIYLVHLSRANSNEKRFIRDVQAATGVPTFTGHEYQESFVPKSMADEA